jgi:predicted AAA+ superfamily ATPase
VLVELERRRYQVTYVRTPAGYEVDFLARPAAGAMELIQVCADPTEEDVADRELRALEDAAQLFPGAPHRSITATADVLPRALPPDIVVQPAYEWLMARPPTS